MATALQGLMMDYPLTVDRILEHGCRVFPDARITTKQPDGALHRYRYADFYARVKRLANVLRALGIEPGERVGTFAWNTYQHLELYYAAPCSGAVLHTLNIRLFPEQLAYIVNHAEDKVVFIDASVLPIYERVAGQIEGVRHYVLMNAEPGIETRLPNVRHYEDLMREASGDFTWAVDDERQAMGLCYTSGTTGNPKGVLYSHRSVYLHSLGALQGNALNISARDVILPVVPMFHVLAWGLPYAGLLAGADFVMPGPHLQGPKLAQLLEEERVTCAAGVPSIWASLYQELKANPRDLSRVRSLIVGGSAMPRSLTEAYERDLGVNVVHAWGMTETSPLGTICVLHAEHDDLPRQQKWDIKERQGVPVAGIELRIVNDAGQELPWDGATMGELQARGPWVCKAYFKIEPTEEHFTADGWFRTGDVATISPDGYLHLTDRTKDLVKSGGEWISSVALENALMAHPQVLEAAVIAIPDERWAERPLAAVVPRPGAEPPSEEELLAHLAPNFLRFWLPDRVVCVEEIPKTSVGKFDKKVLRQRYAEGRLG